ncbi:hypothetical protein R1sor_020982 [Riccia sorocarpa]|uniref:Uncharacterized protein n=1 Tax=Riccia sorocarpa TaxID=122646 RepID=A0ABD3GJE8_9MARC
MNKSVFLAANKPPSCGRLQFARDYLQSGSAAWLYIPLLAFGNPPSWTDEQSPESDQEGGRKVSKEVKLQEAAV